MSGPPVVGSELVVVGLGVGRGTAVVERAEEVRPMGGLPGMVWRLSARPPGGAPLDALVTGGGLPVAADPRYRVVG